MLVFVLVFCAEGRKCENYMGMLFFLNFEHTALKSVVCMGIQRLVCLQCMGIQRQMCVFAVHGNSETDLCICSARELRDRRVFAVDFVSVICNCRASVMLPLGQDTESVWQWYQGHCFLTIVSMMSPSDVLVYLKHTGLQLPLYYCQDWIPNFH